MTEEIINTCKYYENGICSCTIIESGCYCKKIDCIYKQHKRLEQERDDIQDRLFTLADTYQEARNVCKRLEQENKELNFKINQLKANSLYNDLTGIELSAKIFELQQENKQIKSALEEIRENLVKLKTNDEDDFTYEYSKIEDKINEALE